IAGSEVMRFEREGRRPDGSAVKLGFSLVFAEDKGAPQIHFATCQQHYPENFWNSAFQRHANNVSGVAGVVAVAENPDAHHDFMERFAGAAPKPIEAGFSIETPRGVIDVVTPAAFTRRYAVPAPDASRGARLAALRLRTERRSAVIGPNDAMGAALIFETGR